MKPGKPAPDVIKAAARARELFAVEDAEAALSHLEEVLATHDNPRLWRLKARLLVFFGREGEATDILQRILPRAWEVGFWELAQSGLTSSYALLDQTHNLAYFPVRKCSSTSLHNAMALLRGGDAKGEEIHGGVSQYRLLDRRTFSEEIPAFFKFLIVRSPIERVRSFYFGNIAGRDHLVADTGGKERFYGLSTRPSYEEFLDQFDAYRRTFITVRNHTDPLTGYVGSNPTLYDWIGGIHQTAELIDLLSSRTGIDLPALHDMQTKGTSSESVAEAKLRDFYEADYAAYGRWFSDAC